VNFLNISASAWVNLLNADKDAELGANLQIDRVRGALSEYAAGGSGEFLVCVPVHACSSVSRRGSVEHTVEHMFDYRNYAGYHPIS